MAVAFSENNMFNGKDGIEIHGFDFEKNFDRELEQMRENGRLAEILDKYGISAED